MENSENVFDLVVLGAGPAGYVAAIRASQLGMKTACIEKEATLGGTCLNVGCIPSKALLDSSEHYAMAKKEFSKHGIMVSEVKLDLAKMIQRKDQVVKGLTDGIRGLFKKNKITSFQGMGAFKSKSSEGIELEVKSADGNVQYVKGKKVLIATGSVPVELPFLKFDGEHVVSSTEALCFSEVPEHLIVIGGGVIGLELGSVWKRLGAKVTVVEFKDRILPPCDAQMAVELQKILVRQGLEFRCSTKCLGAEVVAGKKGAKSQVVVSLEDLATKEKSTLTADKVLVSTGRRPYADGLKLEAIGIQADKAGRIEIDSHYQTKVPGVYAVGDVVIGPMLAHKAEEEGIAAVEIMAGQAGHVNYEAIPNVVYTWPELASVGATEEELKEKGIEFVSGSFPFAANGRAKAMSEIDGRVKILAHAKTDRVLGVHIVGPRASEMIAEAVTVMEYGGSAEDIARTCHAHPTLPEVTKEAALAVAKRAIHI